MQHFPLNNEMVFVLVEAAGGVYNSEHIRTICQVANTDSAFLKVTEDNRIGFMLKPENIDLAKTSLAKAGLLLRGYRTPGVLAPKACLGELCPQKEQDALTDAIELGQSLQKTFGERPYVAIGVNGCSQTCLGSSIDDVHIVGETSGYKIAIGGKASEMPQNVQFLAENISKEKLAPVVEAVLNTYFENQQEGERLYDVVERIGMSPFNDAISGLLESDLSLAGELTVDDASDTAEPTLDMDVTSDFGESVAGSDDSLNLGDDLSLAADETLTLDETPLSEDSMASSDELSFDDNAMSFDSSTADDSLAIDDSASSSSDELSLSLDEPIAAEDAIVSDELSLDDSLAIEDTSLEPSFQQDDVLAVTDEAEAVAATSVEDEFSLEDDFSAIASDPIGDVSSDEALVANLDDAPDFSDNLELDASAVEASPVTEAVASDESSSFDDEFDISEATGEDVDSMTRTIRSEAELVEHKDSANSLDGEPLEIETPVLLEESIDDESDVNLSADDDFMEDEFTDSIAPAASVVSTPQASATQNVANFSEHKREKSASSTSRAPSPAANAKIKVVGGMVVCELGDMKFKMSLDKLVEGKTVHLEINEHQIALCRQGDDVELSVDEMCVSVSADAA